MDTSRDQDIKNQGSVYKFWFNCRHMDNRGCPRVKAVNIGRIERGMYHRFIRIRAGD